MKDPIIIKITEELRSLLKDDDLSLATRLLLDFLTDITLSRDDFEEALGMRAAFNQLEEVKDLEARRIAKDKFKARFSDFLNRLDGVEKVNEPSAVEDQPAPFRPRMVKDNMAVATDTSIAFQANAVGKQYKNMRFKLGPLDLTLESGKLTGVVGENGNGKTTLLRIIAGDLALSEGQISYPQIANAKDWYHIKQHIAFIPQRLNKWQGLLKDNLHFSASNHGIYGKDNEAMVDFIIHRLGLTKYKNSKWNDISSGYKLRFELAKALVWHPRLLVLDEPLANLDINTKLLFMQDLRLIANIKKFPISIILSSQQLHEIESVVDNILFLKDGQPIYSGAVKDFGDDREENSFEVSGEFSREELMQILKSLGEDKVSIEDTGQSLIVHTPKDIEGPEVLSLISSKAKLGYFRDISKSTRKLFN